LLDRFEAAERGKIERIFYQAILAARDFNVSNLWEQPELAVTYWILLLSGVNQKEELEIAKTLLIGRPLSQKIQPWCYVYPILIEINLSIALLNLER
jgi:hypothetical protein